MIASAELKSENIRPEDALTMRTITPILAPHSQSSGLRMDYTLSLSGATNGNYRIEKNIIRYPEEEI